MPPDTRDRALLLDMLQAAEAVASFIAEKSFEQYVGDDFLRSAIERKVEIVGEAARHVSDAFTSANPQIEWHRIRATRHILAHDYGRVDDSIMWRIATIHLPELIAHLKPLI